MTKIKSDQEIAKEAANYDTGFCNPMKNKFANEARRDAIYELEDRGYSRAEAERMMQRWHRTCLSKAPIRNEAAAHRRAKEKSAERGVKHYVYCCPYCQNWHLTKKAPHQQ